MLLLRGRIKQTPRVVERNVIQNTFTARDALFIGIEQRLHNSHLHNREQWLIFYLILVLNRYESIEGSLTYERTRHTSPYLVKTSTFHSGDNLAYY